MTPTKPTKRPEYIQPKPMTSANNWINNHIMGINDICTVKRSPYCWSCVSWKKLHVLLREISVKLVIQYGDTPVSAFLRLISSKRCIFTKHYAITSMPQPLVMTYVRECLSLPWIPTNKGIKQLVGTWWLLQWLGPAKTLCIAVDNEG